MVGPHHGGRGLASGAAIVSVAPSGNLTITIKSTDTYGDTATIYVSPKYAITLAHRLLQVASDPENAQVIRASTPDPDALPCPECSGGLDHYPGCQTRGA